MFLSKSPGKGKCSSQGYIRFITKIARAAPAPGAEGAAHARRPSLGYLRSTYLFLNVDKSNILQPLSNTSYQDFQIPCSHLLVQLFLLKSGKYSLSD